jgi:hypothetical protein
VANRELYLKRNENYKHLFLFFVHYELIHVHKTLKFKIEKTKLHKDLDLLYQLDKFHSECIGIHKDSVDFALKLQSKINSDLNVIGLK